MPLSGERLDPGNFRSVVPTAVLVKYSTGFLKKRSGNYRLSASRKKLISLKLSFPKEYNFVQNKICMFHVLETKIFEVHFSDAVFEIHL